MLIGIEGDEQDNLAALSRALAVRLEKSDQFAYVTNGAQDSLRADGEFLLRNRYLLSPSVTVERFTAAGIRDALEQQLDLLSSPTSMLVGNLLPRDPTGEMLQIAGSPAGTGRGPARHDGVWFSADGGRALLVAQTRAAGFDIDAQEQALARIRAAFEERGEQRCKRGHRAWWSPDRACSRWKAVPASSAMQCAFPCSARCWSARSCCSSIAPCACWR